MDKYVINGGKKLFGEVNISGAKNAAVAIIPAVVLCDVPCKLRNLPNIRDVSVILSILENMGAKVDRDPTDPSVVTIDPRGITSYKVSCDDLVAKMRASYYLLGALLGKFGKADVPPPGGCKFCKRPIDLHIRAFEALGAEYKDIDDHIVLESNGLHGTEINFDPVSVGATINAILAAVKAEGKTIITSAAKEPHIVDLANFLNYMGANIKKAGTDEIKITGVKELRGPSDDSGEEISYTIIPDQIEAGTYMAAVAAAGGEITINNVTAQHLRSIMKVITETGAKVTVISDPNREYETVTVARRGDLRGCKNQVITSPHPGFPTDMQPPITALLAAANSTSTVVEAVWANRFSYVPELRKLGAEIDENKSSLAIHPVAGGLKGGTRKKPVSVRALDLRAGAAMVIAGLAAEGITEVEDAKYVKRGYEDIVGKLTALGADIRMVTYKEITDDSDE